MTFNHIAIKNFKGNIKTYISYFLCNTFSITVFFLYSTILFNQDFYNSTEIEKGVMNIAVIPTVAVAVFSIFFIIYSHSTFIKRRRMEFGLFMNLGMGPLDIAKLVVVENTIVFFLSITLGIITGTIFSRIFFLFIVNLLEVTTVSFNLTMKSYIVTILVFSFMFIISILISIIEVNRFQISELLRLHRVSEENLKNKVWFGALGGSVVVLSMIVLYIKFGESASKNGELLLFCTLFLFIGLYIALHGFGGLVLNIVKKSKELYGSLLVVSNLNHKFKQVKNIIFIVTVLVIVTIWYSGMLLSMQLTLEKTAEEMKPYDITFLETLDNKDINYINDILYSENNPVTKYENLEFMYFNVENERYHSNIIGSDKYREVRVISNKEFNKLNYKIYNLDKKTYVSVVQKVIADKEFKESYEKRPLIIEGSQYSREEIVFDIVINTLSYLDNDFIILNNEDYNNIKNSKYYIGNERMHVVNFKHWKETRNVVNRLNEMKYKINNKEDHNLKGSSNYISSKIQVYDYNKQAGGLILYLITFIGILFFISICVVLFLRLFSDINSDKDRYKKLYKIGITEEEIKKYISKEIKFIFFIPVIIGVIISFIYTNTFYKGSELYLYGLKGNLIIGGIYIGFQSVYYIICKGIYTKEVLKSI